MGLFRRTPPDPAKEAARLAQEQDEAEEFLRAQPVHLFPGEARSVQYASRDGRPVQPIELPLSLDGDGRPCAPEGERELGRWRGCNIPPLSLFGISVEAGTPSVGPLARASFDLLLTDRYLRVSAREAELPGIGKLEFWHRAAFQLAWPVEAVGWIEAAREGFAVGTFAVSGTTENGELVLPYLTGRTIFAAKEDWGGNTRDDRASFLSAVFGARTRGSAPTRCGESELARQLAEVLRSRQPAQVVLDPGPAEVPARSQWALWA